MIKAMTPLDFRRYLTLRVFYLRVLRYPRVPRYLTCGEKLLFVESSPLSHSKFNHTGGLILNGLTRSTRDMTYGTWGY